MYSPLCIFTYLNFIKNKSRNLLRLLFLFDVKQGAYNMTLKPIIRLLPAATMPDE